MKNSKRKQQAKTLRIFRKVHRTTAILLFVFFFIVSLSGLLLGWKKHSGELILANTYEGTSSNLEDWLPLKDLSMIADKILHDSISENLSLELDRMDIRKEKGVIKFSYKNHYWGLQLDGATGNLLHLSKRHSDLIENIHDGSILDDYFETSNGQIKLAYTTVMGLALLVFTISGFWLWYGPKRMRNRSIKNK